MHTINISPAAPLCSAAFPTVSLSHHRTANTQPVSCMLSPLTEQLCFSSIYCTNLKVAVMSSYNCIFILSFQSERPWQILSLIPSCLFTLLIFHSSSTSEPHPFSRAVSVASFSTPVSPTAISSPLHLCVWVCHCDSENVSEAFVSVYLIVPVQVTLCECANCQPLSALWNCLWLSSGHWVRKWLALMQIWTVSQWVDKEPDGIFTKLSI